jgi:hypothetical protein
MRKQYLHLAIYSCDDCNGPVIAGSLAVRENEISKETEIGPVGAICISCGHRPGNATGSVPVRNLLPIEWDPVKANGSGHVTTAYEALNRAELH